MQKPLRLLLQLSAIWSALFVAVETRSAPWEFFAMDNGVGRGVWPPEQQASVLHEIGFDGISYNYTTAADLARWLAELKSRQLRLYGIYLGAQIDAAPALPADLPESVALLRGSGAVIWLTLPKPSKPGNHDEQAVQCVRQAADLAATGGLRVVLYPHAGFYIATAEQALALLHRVERANVGLTVNLAHELAAGNGSRLPAIIRQVAPLLQMVSLNGASDRSGPGWDNHIKLLGTGDYDVAELLRVLRAVNYTGPVGLQSYNVKGEPKANLAAAHRAWTRLTAPLTPP
jgi:sugar phosphate isomerase/epimerase